jgi:agmatinase
VLRRCHDLIGDGRIHQFGIRSGDREEFRFAREHVDQHRFTLEGLEETIESLKGIPVYFTLDLDVLDPSVFPGTGTPEPGGITFEELRAAVTKVCGALNIVGCDVNELSPHYDPSGVSTAVACKIVREMLLALSGQED